MATIQSHSSQSAVTTEPLDPESVFQAGERKRHELLNKLSSAPTDILWDHILFPEDEQWLPISHWALDANNQKQQLETLHHQFQNPVDPKADCTDAVNKLETISASARKLLEQHKDCPNRHHFVNVGYHPIANQHNACALGTLWEPKEMPSVMTELRKARIADLEAVLTRTRQQLLEHEFQNTVLQVEIQDLKTRMPPSQDEQLQNLDPILVPLDVELITKARAENGRLHAAVRHLQFASEEWVKATDELKALDGAIWRLYRACLELSLLVSL